jgi:hypothetical protein
VSEPKGYQYQRMKKKNPPKHLFLVNAAVTKYKFRLHHEQTVPQTIMAGNEQTISGTLCSVFLRHIAHTPPASQPAKTTDSQLSPQSTYLPQPFPQPEQRRQNPHLHTSKFLDPDRHQALKSLKSQNTGNASLRTMPISPTP